MVHCFSIPELTLQVFTNFMNELTWRHLLVSHPLMQRITYVNVLGANFHIEDVFVGDYHTNVCHSILRSSTQVWALFSETRTLREADISWFRHVASEKRACSLGMRCVTLAARDSCAIFHSLTHRPVPPQRRGLWWPKWEKTASLNARDVLWY